MTDESPASSSNRLTLWRLLAVALLSAAGLAWATPWGLGVSPDSVTYLTAAANLLEGNGLAGQGADGHAVPMTRFPPLYPLLLAIPGLFGLDLLGGARLLGILVYAINVLLAGLAIRRLGGGGPLVLVGAALVAISIPIAWVHLWAWSEPLFLALTLASLWALGEHLERPSFKALLAAAALTALALICRYAGGALVLTAAAGILLAGRRAWRARLLDLTVFMAVVAMPLVGWLVRNRSVAGTAAGRELAYHPITSEQMRVALEVVSSWVPPAIVPVWWITIPLSIRLAALVAVGLGLSLLMFLWKPRRLVTGAAPVPLARLLALFLLAYPLFLFLSLTFVDAYTPLDNRILAPWYAVGLVLLLSAAQSRLNCQRPPRWVVGVGGLALGCVVFSSLLLTGMHAWQSRAFGFEYANRYWRTNPGVRIVEMLSPDVPVYTNAADVLRLHFPGRSVYELPARLDPTSRRPNPHVGEQTRRMLQRLGEGGGAVIYFDAVKRPYLLAEPELTAAAPMKVTPMNGVRLYQLAERASPSDASPR